MISGRKICVPGDLKLLTNYVLREQGEWFEDEIHFVRKLARPGMNAVDVGANYGVYTTAIAEGIGSAGHIWCFEPSPQTATRLRHTVQENGFDSCVEVLELGLSDTARSASFYASNNAELSSLTPGEDRTVIEIELSTLDDCARQFSWPSIDFLKLDAEGEEEKIIKGGKSFFIEQSPLVMFEVNNGATINLELMGALEEVGYAAFYLIPGLGVLAPFTLEQNFDPYLMNLFALKPDRGDKLRDDKLLVAAPNAGEIAVSKESLASLQGAACYRNLRANFSDVSDLSQPYRDIIQGYLASRSESLPIQQRHDSLMQAYRLTEEAITKGFNARPEHLSTLARVAYDAGRTKPGNMILELLRDSLERSPTMSIQDAFVPASEKFESIDTKGRTRDWLIAMVLDQLVRKSSHSTYFHGRTEALRSINTMVQLGFVPDDMFRRRDVITLLATEGVGPG